MIYLDTNVNRDPKFHNFLASTDEVAWLRKFYNDLVSKTPALQITPPGDEVTVCQLLQPEEVSSVDSSQAEIEAQAHNHDDRCIEYVPDSALALLDPDEMSFMQLLRSYASSVYQTNISEYPAAEENIRKLFDIMNTPEKRMPSPKSISEVPGCELDQYSDCVLKISNTQFLDQLWMVICVLGDVYHVSKDTLSRDTLDNISKLRIAILLSGFSVNSMEKGLQGKSEYLGIHTYLCIEDFLDLLKVLVLSQKKIIEGHIDLIISLADGLIKLIFSNTYSLSTMPEGIKGNDIALAVDSLMNSLLYATRKKDYIGSELERFGGPWIFLKVFMSLLEPVDSIIKDKLKEVLVDCINFKPNNFLEFFINFKPKEQIDFFVEFVNALIYGDDVNPFIVLSMLETSNKSLWFLQQLIDPSNSFSLETSLAITRYKDKHNKSVYEISESESSYYNIKSRIQEYSQLMGEYIFATDIDNTLIRKTSLNPELLVAYLQSQGIKTLLIISNCLFDRVPELKIAGYVTALKQAGIKWFHFPLGHHHSKAVFLNSFRDVLQKTFQHKVILGWQLIDDKVRELSYQLTQLPNNSVVAVKRSWLYQNLSQYFNNTQKFTMACESVVGVEPDPQLIPAEFCEFICKSVSPDLLIPASLITVLDSPAAAEQLFDWLFSRNVSLKYFQNSDGFGRFFTLCLKINQSRHGHLRKPCQKCGNSNWDPHVNRLINAIDKFLLGVKVENSKNGQIIFGPNFVAARSQMAVLESILSTLVEAIEKEEVKCVNSVTASSTKTDSILTFSTGFIHEHHGSSLLQIPANQVGVGVDLSIKSWLADLVELIIKSAESHGKSKSVVSSSENNAVGGIVDGNIILRKSLSNIEKSKRIKEARVLCRIGENDKYIEFITSLRSGREINAKPAWDSSSKISEERPRVLSDGGSATSSNLMFMSLVSRCKNSEVNSPLHSQPWR